MIQSSAMKVYEWNQIPTEQMNPLFSRRVIHSETMTVARLRLLKGCMVPMHTHHNEQISMVDEGAIKFVLDGVERVIRAGEVLQIPAHLPHSAEVMEDCVVTDLFSPPREDWIRGDDAYLRK